MGDVTIISATIQEFNGERYYLCGKYFQHRGKRLHRSVWEYFNGEIPEGYHVHHIDEDRANNEIENLSLMPGPEHLSHHMNSDERLKFARENIKNAIAAAPEWHRSAEGRAWHSDHAKEVAENIAPHEEYCVMCHKSFFTKDYRKGNHFCGNNCKSAWRRATGVDDETRLCPACGRTFSANKYSRAVCCCRECAVKKRWNK